MYAGKLVFSQVMDHLPLHAFRRCVSCYQGERYVKQFRCLDQFFVMAFAQLSHRETLRLDHRRRGTRAVFCGWTMAPGICRITSPVRSGSVVFIRHIPLSASPRGTASWSGSTGRSRNRSFMVVSIETSMNFEGLSENSSSYIMTNGWSKRTAS